MSRLFGSVRSRATLGATLVVAVALVAAGTALLLSLRANLTSEAGTRAERSAQAVASELAARTPLDKLSGLDAEDTPVQIVDEDGVLLAASEDLERITGTGTAEVTPAPGRSDADDDRDGEDDDDRDDDSLDPGEISPGASHANGTATIDGDTEDYRFASVEVKTPTGAVSPSTRAPRWPPSTAPWAPR